MGSCQGSKSWRYFFLSSAVYLLALACFFATPAQAAGSQPGSAKPGTPQLDNLLDLVDQRLHLMEEVAAYKFAKHIAVENKQREQVVLANVKASAGQHQLEPASVEAFFRLQIELAKTVQRGWIKHWQAEGRIPADNADIADLKNEIRPQLLALGSQLVKQIPRVLPELDPGENREQLQTTFARAITAPFISPGKKRELLETLLQIRRVEPLAVNALVAVLQRGVLRVGTTGDYPPFSFIDTKNAELSDLGYSGIDIDLAKNLANSLGVKLQLFKTSWPTLMADLAAGQFDIGMSGISRTALRQRSAFFSSAYSSGGKTPISRCEAVAKLNSLSKIDRSNIRVIVNPGGTNEKFVRAHIKNAEIIVYPDNTRIFAQLVDKRAEVMITDAIEVQLQQRRHPELCATMPGELLTRVDKAFLMPRDSALKDYVDVWLAQLKQSGRLQRVFTRHID